MPIGTLDLVGGDLPLPLGGGLVTSSHVGDVDLLVDRLPFWLAITSDSPYQRETAQYQRDQVDQAPEAGEQSLAGWWMRSQMTFHGGAGLDYLDTSSQPDDVDRLRFAESRGVDVWTPGRVTRLPGCTIERTVPGNTRVWVEVMQVGDVDYLAVATSSEIAVKAAGTWATAAVANLRSIATNGFELWWVTPTGVFRCPVTNLAAITQVYYFDEDRPSTIAYVKQRFMLGYGQDLLELTVRDAGEPAKLRYKHPTPGWRWSAISDGPSGVIASGYSGMQSGMFKLELTTVDDAPVLGPGVALLTMPGGERILSTSYYLGSLLVVGTSRGVRVCPFESYYGTITLGPLSVETKAPVTAVGGYDRFVYAGTRVDGEAMLLRLDLGMPLDNAGHYAWAPDLQASAAVAADVHAIAFTPGGKCLWAIDGLGVQLEGSVPGDRPAWLQTSRIRMGTTEDKHFQYGLARGQLSDVNTLTVSVATSLNPNWTVRYTATSSSERFGLQAGRCEWVALRFALAGAAELASYQVQAVPAGKRQRLISFPVSVSDSEVTRSGRHVGYDGWALERLHALEAIEAAGSPVTVQAPALFPDAVECVVEKITYLQTSAPSDRGTGTAGVLQLVVRTIT